ncbi:leucine-rich repeat domain-containing protein [Maribacter sp.]|uniref:leucine-rich repeat domain-containing protein n=1 Tax=Maribacter sp. TaxID=1897614 RepID=UPI0025BF7EAA|nr:hypothetical protein [Maribacter sp.]
MKYFLFIFFLSAFLISCTSDAVNEPEIMDKPVIEEQITDEEISETLQGTQVFQIEFNELKSNHEPQGKEFNLEPEFALVSIIDDNNNAIYNRERLELSEKDGKIETEELILDTGSYKITEFIILDTDNVVISLIPKEGSAMALFTDTILPLEFNVLDNQLNVLPTKNIEAAGLYAIDFGYGELNFNFIENTSFFSITVDETQELTPKFLTLESVTGAVFIIDWGDGTIEEYVSNITSSGFENAVIHNYMANGEYTIKVSGPVATIELLNLASDQASNWRTHITSAEIENLVLLKELNFYSGNLTEINTSSNKALEVLVLGSNNINDLDISNNNRLKHLSVKNNQLSTISLLNNTALEFLSLGSNQITTLDLSNVKTLFGLSIRENQLTNLDISNNTLLNNLDCASNMLSTINISQNLQMVNLNVGDNMLTDIDVSKNINLVRLDLFTNQLNSVDLSNNLNLESLYIQENALSTIDLSNNPKLERLIIENNNFNNLDLSSTPKIFDLEIGVNQFDAATLDMLIDHVHAQATTNNITDGYMDFQNNPGSESISNASLIKINQLISSYNWFFNNN